MSDAISTVVAAPRTRNRFRQITAIATSAIVAFVAIGSIRQPSGPADGVSLAPCDAHADASVSPANSPPRFRLATFNIHGGKGRDGHVDLARTASCLQRFDIVGLNEVHGAWLLPSLDQAHQLADDLDRDFIFAPTERRWWHYDFGNAVLSSMPTQSWRRVPLPHHDAKSYRNFIELTFDVNSQPVHVIVTHLERGAAADRTAQWHEATTRFLALPKPAVLMGDMNMTRDDSLMRELLADGEIIDPLANLPAGRPEDRIDWILVRGLKCFDRGSIDIGASDHPCYWVECDVDR